jgi:hypothetical protein
MQTLPVKRMLSIIVAICVALAFTMIAQTDSSYAATKTYYASLKTKTNIQYSGFKKVTAQTWQDADLSKEREDLAAVQKAISNGAIEYSGDELDWGASFGTVKQKVTTKIAVGNLTTKKPKGGFLEINGLKEGAAQSKYKKLKAKIKKKPIDYCGTYSYFASTNFPAVTMTIGGESFAYFNTEYIYLNNIGKIKDKKATSTGKYEIGISIEYKNGITNEEVAKFLTALTSLKDQEQIVYSFTAPKVKAKNVESSYGIFEKNVDFTQKNSITYSGYKSIANKNFTVTETLRLK